MAARFEKAILTALRAPTHPITVVDAGPVAPGLQRVRVEAPELVQGSALPPSSWLRLWIPNGGQIVQRAFTVRELDREAGRFSLDFVLHEPAGAASRWARAATAGTQIEASVYYGAPFSYPDPLPAGYLFVGDTASLPAINEMVAAAPAGLTVQVVLVAAHAEDRGHPVAPLPAHVAEGSGIRWVDVSAGDRDRELVDAMGRLGRLEGWRFWVALETASTKRVRALLKELHAPRRGDLKAQAYWIEGRSMGTAGDE